MSHDPPQNSPPRALPPEPSRQSPPARTLQTKPSRQNPPAGSFPPEPSHQFRAPPGTRVLVGPGHRHVGIDLCMAKWLFQASFQGSANPGFFLPHIPKGSCMAFVLFKKSFFSQSAILPRFYREFTVSPYMVSPFVLLQFWCKATLPSTT